MIIVGGTEIDVIKVGGTAPDMIYVDGSQVWPSGYYYTLTLKSSQPIYSNTGTSSGTLYASASNYATFYCTYSKKRTSNNAVISTEDVYAIPSASHFNTNGTQLTFDRTNYGTTVLNGGTLTATLTYGAADPITASFSFYGNQRYAQTDYENPVFDSSVYPASASDSSFTGGTMTNYWHYDSGDNVYSSPTYPTWISNSHPSGTAIIANAYTHTLSIPSLGKTLKSQTTYTLTINGDGVTDPIEVTQAANTRSATGYDTFVYSDSSTEVPANINMSPSGGTLSVQLVGPGYTYTSGATEPGSPYNTSSFTNVTYQRVAPSAATMTNPELRGYDIIITVPERSGSYAVYTLVITYTNPSTGYATTIGLTINQ